MNLRDTLLTLAVVIYWGFNFVVMKWGVELVPPVLLSGLRFLFTALPLVFFIKPPKAPWRWVAAYGLLLFFFKFSLIFIALKHGLAAGLAGVTVQVQVFFTVFLAALLTSELPTRRQWLGMAVAAAGLIYIGINVRAESSLLGFMMVIVAGLAWGVANMVTKKIGPGVGLGLVVWGALIATPFIFALSWLLEGRAAYAQLGHALATQPWQVVGVVFLLAYPASIIGYWIFSSMMAKYSAITVGPFSLLIPVAALLSSAWLTSETLPGWKLLGAALVIGGLVITQLRLPGKRRLADGQR
jgi:O-acetylserine/cysteine efflux transporter